MKILLIEDDQSIRKVLTWGLQNERIDVSSASDGVLGLKMASSAIYDLIILDLMLPGKNGDDICKQLRNVNFGLPILVLTAATDLQTKLKLFNCGADDYITKPFEFRELLARIKAALRKQKMDLNDILTFGDLKIDLRKQEVTRHTKKISMRQKEIKILEYMVRHAEQVLTRDMIIDYVWGPSTERYTNVVDVHIHHLREKIDKPYNTKMLKSVSGVGYKISKEP